MNKLDVILILILLTMLVAIFALSIHITYKCYHILDQYLRAPGLYRDIPTCLSFP